MSDTSSVSRGRGWGRGRGSGGGGGGGSPARGRGGDRGGHPQRGRGTGGPAPRGRGSHLIGTPSQGGPGLPSSHVTTIGVKRTAFGTAGRAVQVATNHFEVRIPQGIIYHYDGKSPR